MKVALVTTWGERCGLAAYSANIVKHLPEIDWRIIGREEWGDSFTGVPAIAAECDVCHIMHQGGLMASMSPGIVKACGKTVITKQCIGDEAVFDAADIKTSHIHTVGYVFVPHGIPVVDVSGIPTLLETLGPSIGCAGIPFSGKGHWEAVKIAQDLGWTVNLVMPQNPHTGDDLARLIIDHCMRLKMPAVVEQRWLPEDDVVRILAQSTVNIFYYTRWANGISGAVRLGLAAGRPVIVSNHSQFADIIPTGLVTVATTLDGAKHLASRPDKLPNPNPLVDLWGYNKTAKMYLELYQRLYDTPS